MPKKKEVQIRDGSGVLDPMSFVKAGRAWTVDWLRSRLSGLDPYFPVDHRFGEDAAAGLGTLLRDIGTGHPASALFSVGVRQLLEELSQALPDYPVYGDQLIRLLQLTYLPAAHAWLKEQLRYIAVEGENARARWGTPDRIKEVLYAALKQVAGTHRKGITGLWENLLTHPAFATIALEALSGSVDDRLHYLQQWWETHPPNTARDLRQIVYLALREVGRPSLIASLRAVEAEFSYDLRRAIDAALRAEAGCEAFVHVPPSGSGYTSAITNAAIRPELFSR